MQEQLISLETAKLAKEKGFDWKTENVYSPKNEPNKSKHEFTDSDWDSLKYLKEAIHFPYEHFTHISAPTQSLLQKWLRENPKLILWCIPIGTDYEDFVVWDYKIRNHTNGREHTGKLQLKTYEEALEKGLQEALKLIK